MVEKLQQNDIEQEKGKHLKMDKKKEKKADKILKKRKHKEASIGKKSKGDSQ